MNVKRTEELVLAQSEDIVRARQTVRAWMIREGFSLVDQTKMVTAASELARNAVDYGGGGVVLLEQLLEGARAGLRITFTDRGPGIPDLELAQTDGYSTGTGLGTGLGAVRRLSSVFDIYAPPGAGTAVLSRIWAQAPQPTLPLRPLTVGAVCLPVDGEEACGDAWAVHQAAERSLVMVADGLGHGPAAGAAAAQAMRTFRAHPERGVAELVTVLDAALRPTRGAAVAIAEIVPQQGVVNYAGLGNIAGRIYGGETVRNLVTTDGTAGTGTRKTHEYTYPWPPDGLLLMHSDGLASHWDLDSHFGLLNRHPSLIAGVLFRDHRRQRDDVTIVAVTQAQEKHVSSDEALYSARRGGAVAGGA